MALSAAEQMLWWHAPEGEAWKHTHRYASAVESRQAGHYNRIYKCRSLYDPNATTNLYNRGQDSRESLHRVTENVVASNVDTVTAVEAASAVRARFQTDDGDWSEQRRAKQLEFYTEALGKLLGVDAQVRQAFRHGAMVGSGIVTVYPDQDGQIQVEQVFLEDCIVDEMECRFAPPKQFHRRRNVDRELLKEQFPGFDEQIDRAGTLSYSSWRAWSAYQKLERNECTVLESIRRPIGVKGKPRYKPGRRVICIDGCDLLDEEWHKPHFRIAKFDWTPRDGGWYGISLTERIAGHQRALNKRNWQIDRTLDQCASPTTYVRQIDAKLAVQTVNTIGNIAVVKGDIPQAPVFPQVNPEVYKSRDDLKGSAFEETGLSRMAASSTKPAGIDSAVGLREFRDQGSERFAIQEGGLETMALEVDTLLLDACKDLGDAAPVVSRKTKFGAKKIKWSQVDMDDVRVQICAASTLDRTPSGRAQTVTEWAQAGIISQDDARRLIDHPDLERAMSLYTAALEDIEECIEEIEDGQTLMPEPYQNLKMGIWRMQMSYLKDRGLGAPEEVLEGLRQWIVQAAYIESGGTQQTAPMDGSGAMPMQPGQPGAPPAPGAMPPGAPPIPLQQLQAGAPMGGPAQAAFSPQAMQTIAAP